jgi:hypothetical protein
MPTFDGSRRLLLLGFLLGVGSPAACSFTATLPEPGPASGGADGSTTDEGSAGARDTGSSPPDGAAADDVVSSEAGTKKESACGATVPPASEIVDASGDVWTLTASGQIARNGLVDPVTNGVVLLLYFKGVVYQEAHDLWWAWQGGSWQDAVDPRVAGNCTGFDGGGGGLPYMLGFGGASESRAQVAAAEAAFGRTLDLATDGTTIDGFQFGPYTSSNGRTLGKILIFEMLSMSWDTNQSLQDMSQAASGAYDDAYTRVAQAIANFGAPVVSVRIGHEMNGDWYPWSAVDGNTHNATPANYIATFKRIAQIVRKYNPHTLIEWCANIQPSVPTWPDSRYTPLDYWVGAYDPTANPGGADVISMDFYEGGSGSNFDTDVLGGQFGLAWLAKFAQQNGVKIALSEVATGLSNSPGEGAGCPCSNDGVFMQRLVDWINGLPAGRFTHFVFSPWAPADDLLASGSSAIQQVWRKNWGNTHFAGSWWTGGRVPSQP